MQQASSMWFSLLVVTPMPSLQRGDNPEGEQLQSAESLDMMPWTHTESLSSHIPPLVDFRDLVAL